MRKRVVFVRPERTYLEHLRTHGGRAGDTSSLNGREGGDGAPPPAGLRDAHVPEREQRRHVRGQVREGAEENEKNTVEGLLALAASMTEENRKELLDRLALGAQRSGKADPDLDMWSEAVQEALLAAIGQAPGVLAVRSVLGASRSWNPVREFMASSGLAELKVPERRSVYGLLARIVVDDAASFCEWAGAPLGPRVIAQRCANIAATFDRSFPGYLATGPHVVALMARRLTGARAA